MGVLTDSGVMPPVVATFFDRKLLIRALPRLVHARVTQRRSLRQRSGNTIVFRRVEALALATTPLVEGMPPAGSKLSHTDISVKIQQWGDYVTVTDLVKATIDHPLLNDANKVLGEQAAQTIDVLTARVEAAGTQIFLGGNVATRGDLKDTGQKVDGSILDRAVRLLDENNATRYTQIIGASVKVNTFPIRAAFWAITHPDVIFTLQELAGWISLEEYAGTGKTMEAEKGAFKDLRFLSTTQATVYRGGGGTAAGDVKSTSALADVYTILIFAEEAVASVPFEAMSLENIIKPIGASGAADPLNQRGTSGWKHTGARIRLNELFMVRIEVTAAGIAP